MAEVASAFVSLMFSAEGAGAGIRKEVEKQTRGIGTSAGKKFSGEFKATAATGLKSALPDIERLSAQLTDARDKEATAAGKVRVAETRLAELRDSGKAKASTLARAEEQLASAQRGLAASQSVTRKHTRALTAAQQAQITAQTQADIKTRTATPHMQQFSDGVNKMSSRVKTAAVRLARFGGLVGGIGFAALAKQSVSLEAEFGKTMSVLQATTDASADSMKRLDALAMKMGADTAFSASDASKAMLELARGGISAASIEAGALKGTMTLAAAGELEMADAANYTVKAMGQFNLKGKDASAVAAALAGGANASSASVQDMGSALAQSGLAANSVGFSLQETTAVLAAFSKNGLEGSDAGTSLKTALDRLQPTTNKAKAAMISLGGWSAKTGSTFIKANGEFKSAAEIAEILHKNTEKLGQAERKRLITQAFGSDAQRAATILAKEGAAGLKPLIKATSDQAAADKMAKANMSGTAGALERLKGAAETAQLQLGKALAPTIQAIANTLADKVIPAVTGFVTGMQDGTGAGGAFADAAKSLWHALKDVWHIIEPVLNFLADNLESVGTFAGVVLTAAAAAKVWAGAQALLNIALVANPIGLIVVAVAALAAGFVYLYKHSETFRLGVLALTKGLLFMAEWGVRAFALLLDASLNTFGGILSAAEKGLGWIPGIGDKIKTARDAFDDFRNSTVDKLNDVADKIKGVRDSIDLIPRSRTFTLNMVTVKSTQDKNALGEFGGPRATGGPVSPRKFYLVGENGPELFAPRTPGSIIPNGAVAAGGGGSQTFRGVLSIDRDGVAYIDGVARQAIEDGEAARYAAAHRTTLGGRRR